MKISAIEIGTNSTKFIVAEVQCDGGIKVVEKKSEANRLSRGMYKDFRLTKENIETTVEIIGNFLKLSEQKGATLVSTFSTSVLRDAINRNDLIERVKELFNVDINVITGEQEAQFAYSACKDLAGDSDTFNVIDIGGGSTELVFSSRGEAIKKFSLDIGSVRVTSLFIKSDPISDFEESIVCEHVNKVLRETFLPEINTNLIGTGGTIKAISKMIDNHGIDDESIIHGMNIDIDKIKFIYNTLKKLSYEERILVEGIETKRADVILSGIIILLEIMKYNRIDSITVSSQGVKEGFLKEFVNRQCKSM